MQKQSSANNQLVICWSTSVDKPHIKKGATWNHQPAMNHEYAINQIKPKLKNASNNDISSKRNSMKLNTIMLSVAKSKERLAPAVFISPHNPPQANNQKN